MIIIYAENNKVDHLPKVVDLCANDIKKQLKEIKERIGEHDVQLNQTLPVQKSLHKM